MNDREAVERWAKRNGELHVALRKLLDAYRAVCPDDPYIWEVERVLADIPQLRQEVAGYIPKDQLQIGAKYECAARNFEVGLWNGEVFEYQRTKFGTTFPDTEQHWDDGPPHGTVKPMKKVGEQA